MSVATVTICRLCLRGFLPMPGQHSAACAWCCRRYGLPLEPRP